MDIGRLQLCNVKIEFRDFRGLKFDPDYKTFSVEIQDPEVLDKLVRDEAKLWVCTPRNGNPPRNMLQVQVSLKQRGLQMTLIRPDGSTLDLDPSDPEDMKLMDKSFIDDASVDVVLSRFPDKRGVEHTHVYLQCLVARLLGDEEVAAIKARSEYSSPLLKKYGLRRND